MHKPFNHKDEPLNEEGLRHALELQKKLAGIDFSAAFSSDLSRAYDTAKIVLGQRNVEIVKTPELRERYLGLWEGKLIKDLKAWVKDEGTLPENYNKNDYLSYKWHNVESFADVYNRLNKVIKDAAIQHLDKTIADKTIGIFCHAGLLCALLYHLDFKEDMKWQVTNCGYIKLLVNEAGEISIAEKYGINLTKEAKVPF